MQRGADRARAGAEPAAREAGRFAPRGFAQSSRVELALGLGLGLEQRWPSRRLRAQIGRDIRNRPTALSRRSRAPCLYTVHSTHDATIRSPRRWLFPLSHTPHYTTVVTPRSYYSQSMAMAPGWVDGVEHSSVVSCRPAALRPLCECASALQITSRGNWPPAVRTKPAPLPL